MLTSIAAFFGIWASYSFRYAPLPDGQVWDYDVNLRQTNVNVGARGQSSGLVRAVSTEEIDYRWDHPTLLVKTLTFMNDHRIVPQTWTYGMLYVYRKLAGAYELSDGAAEFLTGFPVVFSASVCVQDAGGDAGSTRTDVGGGDRRVCKARYAVRLVGGLHRRTFWWCWDIRICGRI